MVGGRLEAPVDNPIAWAKTRKTQSLTSFWFLPQGAAGAKGRVLRGGAGPEILNPLPRTGTLEGDPPPPRRSISKRVIIRGTWGNTGKDPHTLPVEKVPRTGLRVEGSLKKDRPPPSSHTGDPSSTPFIHPTLEMG